MVSKDISTQAGSTQAGSVVMEKRRKDLRGIHEAGSAECPDQWKLRVREREESRSGLYSAWEKNDESVAGGKGSECLWNMLVE